MELFGTDGVRGLAGGKLNPINVMRLAIAAGIHLKKNSKYNKILVGKDTRRSGYMIENALVSGLTSVGFDVIQIGPMPTPAIAFITENMRCDAGIMITASHNPYYDNGIKFFGAEGNKLNHECESEIEAIFHNMEEIENAFVTKKEIGRSVRIDDVVGRYIVHIKNSFPKKFSLYGKRIVVDCSNGAAYIVAPTVLRELGAEVIVLSSEPDGYNINTNCGATNPEALVKKVIDTRADIGIALDGDADRIVIVDEKGNIVDGDKLIGALAMHLKNEKKLANDKVVATVMSNQGLEDYLASHGIKLERSDVGDKHVLEIMSKVGSNFGGEQSGHVIFSDYAKTGDGLVSGLQAFAYMIETNKTASEAFNVFDLYPQELVNISISHKIPINEITGVQELFSEIEAAGMRYLVRYSGTENLMRILLEGKNQAKLLKMLDKTVSFFKKALQ
ncbi:MAG: Phosphoglucosamine mutase (EC [uncultured Sulfurovum sp.]|uniref:Phosphoglucosamine mutase n=1 Tax=uncultured Sulfurovum sp. TaxID=269237 RepID=A0A6S6TA86_9BACT|nr:MAG: Phosphoglucosamine mutase (EC [uncultured Sulfurovum sp.]